MIEIRGLTKAEADDLLQAEYVKMTEPQYTRMAAAVRRSKLRGLWRDGTLIGVWGVYVSTILSDEAFIWLHVTPEFKGNEFVFVRQSQMVVQDLHRRYSKLTGLCESNNILAQRWLKWLGAKFGEGDPKPFIIEASHG